MLNVHVNVDMAVSCLFVGVRQERNSAALNYEHTIPFRPTSVLMRCAFMDRMINPLWVAYGDSVGQHECDFNFASFRYDQLELSPTVALRAPYHTGNGRMLILIDCARFFGQ